MQLSIWAFGFALRSNLTLQDKFMPLKLDLKLKSKIRSQIANSKKKFEIFWIFLELSLNFGLNFLNLPLKFAWILALWVEFFEFTFRMVEFFEFILEFTQIRALKAEFLPKFTQNSGVKE